MARGRSGINVITADDSYQRLVRQTVEQVDTSSSHWSAGNYAHVLLDFPLTWAVGQLRELNSIERARTIVATQATHSAYRDMLASFHVSGVVAHHDSPALITGIYAAASALKTYQWRSGLTYMELRVTRLLVLAYDTAGAAAELRVSQKTINAHISNILTKLGYDTRAQYVAALLSHNSA